MPPPAMGGAGLAFAAFALEVDAAWLVRCSILSALAEQPEIPLSWLLELASMAITDADGKFSA